MPEVSKDLITLLNYLLPGFLAAWVLYGLTSDLKPSQFERVVQALVLSFLVHAVLPVFEVILSSIGTKFVILRGWDVLAENVAKLLIALSIGVLLAYFINTDSFHSRLRKYGLTTRSSYPSEWFGVFSEKQNYVILHMVDERRLMGWPKEWPSEFDKGHFYITEPSWLNNQSKDDKTEAEITERASQIELHNVDGLIISAKDVKWVEFLKTPEEGNDG